MTLTLEHFLTIGALLFAIGLFLSDKSIRSGFAEAGRATVNFGGVARAAHQRNPGGDDGGKGRHPSENQLQHTHGTGSAL